MHAEKPESASIWRFSRATRAHAVIDAADYFEIIQAAMMNAKHRIMLIGWDFDTRIDLTRSRRKKGAPPKRLGDFILWLADRTPGLEIKLLKWNIGALKMLGRGKTIVDVAKWAMHSQIEFKLDSAHPVGCSHHQKIVVIDDKMAACGGIDMTADRWDTRELYGPWHDCTMLVEGEAATALAELSRERWVTAGGEPMEPCPDDAASPWPEFLNAEYQFVEMGIARTRAEYEDAPEIREVQALFLEQIAKAKKFIYAENQYFTSPKIADAIAARLKEAHPPEIVIVGPEKADGWLEQKAMDGARVELVRALKAQDNAKCFAYYIPHTARGEPIYVHAKLMIVDDRILRIGSANMNNRSLGLDSECDIFIDCDRPGNDSACETIRQLRASLIGEHIGLPPERVSQLLEQGKSMCEIIDNEKGSGPTLQLLKLPELDQADRIIAENAALDPESPEEMFEPFSSPGLFARVRNLRKPGGRRAYSQK
jgi:phosphatidylserine/phosphatidylglycerophosphate/cardiolipin synthase-like enzyme